MKKHFVMSFVLLLKTSAPHVSVGVADETRTIRAQRSWDAGRELSDTLLQHILAVCKEQNRELAALDRIVVHRGPGGFTTLRIGVATANALGYALDIPVVGVTGPIASLEDLLLHTNDTETTEDVPVMPFYDRPPHITPPVP